MKSAASQQWDGVDQVRIDRRPMSEKRNKNLLGQISRVDAECRECSNTKIQNAISILSNTINNNSIQKLKNTQPLSCCNHQLECSHCCDAAQYTWIVTRIVNSVCVNCLIDFKTSLKVSVTIAGDCNSIRTLDLMVAIWNGLCVFQFLYWNIIYWIR